MRPGRVGFDDAGLSPEKEWRSPLGADKLEVADEQIRSSRKENADGKVYRTGRARVKLHARSGESKREAAKPPGGGDQRAGSRGCHRGDRGPASHLCLEEGTLSGWLYEVLSPHVGELVVAGVSESAGSKNDRLDAFARAERLRIGAIGTKVYKSAGPFARLRHLAKAYAALVSDSVRVQNRIKSLLHARGVAANGGGVYAVGSREEWLARLRRVPRGRVVSAAPWRGVYCSISSPRWPDLDICVRWARRAQIYGPSGDEP